MSDNDSRENFVRDSKVPQKLQVYQPKEVNLSLAATKLIKKRV